MTAWKSYKQFSESYIKENWEFILNDVLNQVIAFILYPPLEKSHTFNSLMQIPSDSYFRESWNQAYPLWLLEKKWPEKEAKNHFKIVDRLVLPLLRLGRRTTHVLVRDGQSSMREMK